MGYAASAWREDTAFLVREVADAPYGAAAEPAEEAEPAEAAGPAEEADPDLLDDLADEIATLAAHIHAATHRMLVLLARFDRLRGWEASGQRSCAHWLAFRTGYDLGTAREHVRVARALEELPRTGEAMSRGRLSFSQVRALTAGFEPSRAACDCGGPRAEAAAAPEVPISGTRAERYQVMLHVDAQTLSADGEPGRSELEDGTRVSAETSRRLSCDAGLVTVTRGPDGSVLDVGRRTRTIPPALRRALEVRDRGCRFPGCGLRFTDAHHLLHWADGGKTSLDNTLLLCSYHHRLVHEGGWRVQWWREGRLTFLDPRGQQSLDASRPPPTLPRNPVKALVRRNRLRGAEPDGWTAGARWKWERDIPDEIYLRVTEAL